jgi:hypothetical protein
LIGLHLGLACLAKSVDVQQEGVGGAKSFFDGKAKEISNSNKNEQVGCLRVSSLIGSPKEIKKEQEEKKKEREAAAERKANFKEKASAFHNT